MNIADIVDVHARSRPDAAALLRGDWQMTYAQAAAALRHIGGVLAREGVGVSTVVGVSMRAAPALMILGVLAIARLGAIAVPLHPDNPRARRNAIGAHFGFSALLTNRRELSIAKASTILADASWLEPRASAEEPPRHPGGEHPWAITLTSGTTGVPKGVPRTHAGFFALSRLQQPLYRLGPDSRFLCLMDIHNTAVIMRALNHLSCGGALVFLHGKFPGTALPIERHRVTHVFASPVIMQAWLKARPAGRPRFESIEQLMVGGGVVPARLGAAIVERITPNLFLSYGTTETGVIALADPETRARHPDTAGRLVPWVEAQTVDQGGQPLPAGERGALRFRGEGVARGYHDVAPGPAAPSSAFRDGWFYPGDAGRIDDERLLFIDGRIDDDVMNVGGPKINAAAVEALLAEHPGVREAAVFTVNTPAGKTRMVAAVAVRGALDPASLIDHYRKRGGRFSRLLSIVRVAKLPRNAMGKVLKRELKRVVRFKPWRKQ
jgi:acyl-coenzyme A synthetase/AMP-(fatty) acid ligase